MKRALANCFILATMLLALPLVGIILEGDPIRQYVEFPPIARYVRHAGFSPFFFYLLALLFLCTTLLLVLAASAGRNKSRFAPGPPHARLPWWGWAGLGGIVVGWIFAWNRFQWLIPVQHHTFLLLWMGYIFLVNGLCLKRTGRSLLTDNPGRFTLLFPASAVFWWFFEYLNRFVQNWYYLNVSHFTAIEYILLATLSFSTVLPAVLSTTRLLLSFPIFQIGLQELKPFRIDNPKRLAWTGLTVSAVGLSLIGVLPDLLFPLLWVSPLLIIVSLQFITGEKTIFSRLSDGDWRTIIPPALGALVCGFFWELWNWNSLAKWEYAIPYVHCCKVFEMPLLGYLGYLPFGLECMVVGERIQGSQKIYQLGEQDEGTARI